MTVPAWVKASVAGLGLGAAVGAGAVALLLAGECSAWRKDHPKPKPLEPVVLVPSQEELATPHETLPCVTVQVLKPSEKRAKQIAKETGRPVPAPVAAGGGATTLDGEIGLPGATSQAEPDYPLLLADGREYPESPTGGKIWVHLEQDGSTTIVAKPHPEKPAPEERFFQFGNVWEVGAVAGIGTGGDTRGRGWAAVEPLRLGRIHVRGEIGVDLRGGETGGYAMAGFVYRSR